MDQKTCWSRLRKMAQAGEFQNRFPSMIVECETGCGEEEFFEEYTELVREQEVLGSAPGVMTLRLKYPGSGSELEMKRFFASPGIVARSRAANRFHGAFYIDLSEAEEVFSANGRAARLADFISANRDGVRYVFHVKRSQTSRQLIAALGSLIPLEHVSIPAPSEEECLSYVVRALAGEKVQLSREALYLARGAIRKLRSRPDFQYGITLAEYVRNLKKELYLSEYDFQTEVSAGWFAAIQESVLPREEASERKIGFAV